MIIDITTIFVCVLYVCVVLFFYVGWIRLKQFSPQPLNPKIFTSIIISARNEAQNIGALLNDIVKQDLPTKYFEVLIIDDHSEDQTASVVQKLCERHSNVFFHQLTEGQTGKKVAIKYAIEKAKGSLIVTTDADCRMGTKWLSIIVQYFEKYAPKMILGPVFFHEEKTIFQWLQSLEFSSLIASGAGAAGVFKPVLCNGANLAFEKNAYLEIQNALHSETTSGDDIFLMHSLKKKHKKEIHFLKSNEAIVYTKPQKNLVSFLSQRIRWSAKSKSYSDRDSIVVTIVVFLMNLSLMVTFILGFFNLGFLYLFAGLLVLKAIVDFIFLRSFLVFFHKQKLLVWFIPMQFFYFVYVCAIGIFGSFVTVKWKGRKVH